AAQKSRRLPRDDSSHRIHSPLPPVKARILHATEGCYSRNAERRERSVGLGIGPRTHTDTLDARQPLAERSAKARDRLEGANEDRTVERARPEAGDRIFQNRPLFAGAERYIFAANLAPLVLVAQASNGDSLRLAERAAR